jgi:hypothetical protein
MQRLIAILLSAVVLLLGILAVENLRSSAAPHFDTPYQAVVLNNGSVYYGKLESPASMYPVLRDIFYVVRKESSETRQLTNVLVRRGQELHGPDHMVLNRASIVFIEPVRQDSEIGKLIAQESKSK